MGKDINRLKVVLAERKGQENGLRSNWERILQQFVNGARILLNQD